MTHASAEREVSFVGCAATLAAIESERVAVALCIDQLPVEFETLLFHRYVCDSFVPPRSCLSTPEEKSTGTHLFGGTLNQEVSILIRVREGE